MLPSFASDIYGSSELGVNEIANEPKEDGGSPVGAVGGALCVLLFVAAAALLLLHRRRAKRRSDEASTEEARSATGIDRDRDLEAVAMSADEEERMYGGRRRSSESVQSISSARRSARGSSRSLSPDIAEAPAPIPASPGRIKILI